MMYKDESSKRPERTITLNEQCFKITNYAERLIYNNESNVKLLNYKEKIGFLVVSYLFDCENYTAYYFYLHNSTKKNPCFEIQWIIDNNGIRFALYYCLDSIKKRSLIFEKDFDCFIISNVGNVMLMNTTTNKIKIYKIDELGTSKIQTKKWKETLQID